MAAWDLSTVAMLAAGFCAGQAGVAINWSRISIRSCVLALFLVALAILPSPLGRQWTARARVLHERFDRLPAGVALALFFVFFHVCHEKILTPEIAKNNGIKHFLANTRAPLLAMRTSPPMYPRLNFTSVVPPGIQDDSQSSMLGNPLLSASSVNQCPNCDQHRLLRLRLCPGCLNPSSERVPPAQCFLTILEPAAPSEPLGVPQPAGTGVLPKRPMCLVASLESSPTLREEDVHQPLPTVKVSSPTSPSKAQNVVVACKCSRSVSRMLHAWYTAVFLALFALSVVSASFLYIVSTT
jgi:hypothetical protein